MHCPAHPRLLGPQSEIVVSSPELIRHGKCSVTFIALKHSGLKQGVQIRVQTELKAEEHLAPSVALALAGGMPDDAGDTPLAPPAVRLLADPFMKT